MSRAGTNVSIEVDEVGHGGQQGERHYGDPHGVGDVVLQ